MIIESIELKNYRQYRHQTIVFALGGDEKRITVIQGANGAGKTNLLNSVTWCLYDEERHLGDADRGLPLVNNVTLNALELDQICHVKVELVLRTSNKEKMIVARKATFKKTGENKAEKIEGTLDVFYQKGSDLKQSPEPQLTISQCLPRDIQEYFFFHCERLDDYFKGPSKSRRIKEEVFKISQLALFENVASHLKNRDDEYSKELNKDYPEADHIKRLIDDKQTQLREAASKLEKYSDEETEASKLERQLVKNLRDYPSSQEIRDWQDRRDTLEAKGNRLEQEIAELTEEHKDFLIKIAPLLMANEAISFMQENISIKDAAGLIPPPYRRSFLRELLKRGYCICETEFSQNRTAKKKVEELFRECDRVTDISHELSVELKNLETMKASVNSFHGEHVRRAKQIANMQKELEEIGLEEKKISEKLKHVDDEKIRRWEQELDVVKKKGKELIENRARRKKEVEDLKTEIGNLTKEYERELKKIHKHTQLKKKLLFCSKAMAAASCIKDEIMNEIRNEIEDLTRRQFFELIWKRENFKTVQISEDYDISVLDQNGVETIGTLSDGERQVLALSFIAALNIISGFDAPIMIDTPLGRISKDPKSNIAEKLPHYLNGKQLTLLVTEEEYTEEVRTKMREFVGREYEIKFRETETGNEAEVIEHEAGSAQSHKRGS